MEYRRCCCVRLYNCVEPTSQHRQLKSHVVDNTVDFLLQLLTIPYTRTTHTYASAAHHIRTCVDVQRIHIILTITTVETFL